MTRGNVASRWIAHQRDSRREQRRYHFASALRKHGAEAFDVYVVATGVAPDQLANAECRYIADFMSCDRAFGFNSTTGGDGGYEFTSEVREKIGAAGRGRKLSDEHKAKVSAASRGRPKSEATREKLRTHRLGMKLNEKWCAALSESHKGKRPTASTREKMALAQKARAASTRTSHAAKMRALWATPEFREKVQAALREKLQSDEHREKRREIARTKTYSPELRERLRQAANRRWEKVREPSNS